jgi:hypothetical protein
VNVILKLTFPQSLYVLENLCCIFRPEKRRWQGESHMGKRNQEFMLLFPPETSLIQAEKATGEYKINNKSCFI